MKPRPLDLRREDYPDLAGPRIEKLIRALNESVGSLVQILNGALRLSDNAASRTRDVLVTGGVPVSFKNDLGVPPSMVLIASAASVAGGKETPVAVYGPAWSANRDLITIQSVGNLTAGVQYRIRFVLIAG